MPTQAYAHEVTDRITHLERKLNLFCVAVIGVALSFIITDLLRPRLA
jgi:hypothetical protein